MKKLKNLVKKRWVWGIGAFLLFTLGFAVFFGYRNHQTIKAADDSGSYSIVYGSGDVLEGKIGSTVTGSYTLCRRTDYLYFRGRSDISNTTVTWSVAQDEAAPVIEATAAQTVDGVLTGDTLTMEAKSPGTVTVTGTAKLYNADSLTFVIQVTVGFSINRAYYSDAGNGVWLKELYKDDTSADTSSVTDKYSIIMNEGATWDLGTGPENGVIPNSKLNLVYGNAQTDVTWESGNENIVTVENNKLVAHGGGHTILKAVSKTEANSTPDTIDVYVNPKVEINGTAFLAGNNSTHVTVNNQTDIEIPKLEFLQNDSSDTIKNRIRWKAERLVDGNWVPLCDSLGYEQEGAETLKMEWSDAKKAYTFNGKAGEYKLSFYPGDAYEGQGKNISVTACTSVIVDVNSSFVTHTTRLNVGGRYDLSSGLNIPRDLLQNEFTIEAVKFLPDGLADKDENYVESKNYVEVTKDGIITAKQIGEAKVTIKADKNKTMIPGVTGGDSITVTIIIGESFSLTSTEMTLVLEQQAEIYGVLSTGDFPDGSTFAWSTPTNNDGDQYIEIVGEKDGKGVTVRAKKKTVDRKPVVLTLEWTNAQGVTQVATCKITVSDSATPVTLDKTELSMQSDDRTGETLTVTNFVKGTNLMWVTSDTQIAIVQPDADYENMARVIPQGKTGVVYVTVINKDNNQTAICRVTVNQYMTELKIDKGGSYTAKLSDTTVLMKATYTPSNATSTGVAWTSSTPDVAWVEANGLDCIVHLKSAGTTIIRVASTDQPAAYSVYTECLLTVETVPLTGIAIKETSLTMLVGDTYTVTPTLTPANAENKTLSWETGNSSVAKVDNNGVITAVSVGQTTITVSGGQAKPVSMIVTVMNKLNSISFSEKDITVEVGESYELNVIFNPSANVNTELSFSSTDTSIVSVDSDGVITGEGEGMAMITAASEELGVFGAISCMIHVVPPTVKIEEFDIDPTEMTLRMGEEKYITPIYTPEDTTEQVVSYSSADETVATVDGDGLVKAVQTGHTIIYCEDVASGKIAVCQVTVESGIQFKLSPETREIALGKSFQLTMVTVPEEIADLAQDDGAVTWESSNPKVATVSETGKVTGKKLGSCTITCTLIDYNQSATCRVTVANLSSTIKLNKTSVKMKIGTTYRLKKTVTSNNTSLPKVKFTSKNSKIASVGQTSGKITAKKAGSTVITAKTVDEIKATAKCRVTVIRRKTKVSLNKSSIRMNLGSTYRLKKTVTSNYKKLPKVKFTSKNTKVATVGQTSGRIKAKRLGSTVITAQTVDEVKSTAKCRVTVIRRATSISLNKAYGVCYIGRSIKLKATVKPNNASIKKVRWTSSDKAVAAVNGGKVTGYSEGETYITATTTDGSNKKARCLIKVSEAVATSNVMVAQSDLTMKKGDTAQLSYTILPKDHTDSVKMASDNKRVATVTNKGKVKAIGTGSATITITADSGVTATVTVNVVALNKTSLRMRQYDTDTIEVLGTSASITWYSANPRIATVSGGKITGKGIGTTYVYAYVNGCKMGCKVEIVSVDTTTR